MNENSCIFFPAKTMASKPLEVLRKGLQVLTDRAKTKEALEAQPAERKAISSSQDADEQCPDHEADLVGERRVLEALENGAPDYERGFARLDDEQKGLVKKLREAAGDGDPSLGNAVVGVGKKRKRASVPINEIFPHGWNWN